jgi:hypothetical protein
MKRVTVSRRFHSPSGKFQLASLVVAQQLRENESVGDTVDEVIVYGTSTLHSRLLDIGQDSSPQ